MNVGVLAEPFPTRVVRALAVVRRELRLAPKIPIAILVVAAICAIFAPLIAPRDPITADLGRLLEGPSLAHPLGTDHLGRDVLSRLIFGTRISFAVGLIAVTVSGVIGTVIAVVAGVFRGPVDALLMQITDAALSVPFLMIAVVAISVIGASVLSVILVIGLLRWMSYARVLRSEVLVITELDYVRAAAVAGASRLHVIRRHVLPNLVGSITVLCTIELGTAIIYEASLSFLGLGVPRPLPSLGTMLIEATPYLYNAWWLPIYPGLAIFAFVLASNMLGDWLRDRVDPLRGYLYALAATVAPSRAMVNTDV